MTQNYRIHCSRWHKILVGDIALDPIEVEKAVNDYGNADRSFNASSIDAIVEETGNVSVLAVLKDPAEREWTSWGGSR